MEFGIWNLAKVVSVAQPDRASDFGSEGWGFESLQARILAALIVLVFITFGWLGWKCLRDPKINFLPGDRRAEWIIFPAAIDARSHPVAKMDATFRRTFSLDSAPRAVRLELRAAKRVELTINGEPVPSLAVQNWKQMSDLDVSRFVRSGENKIEARVFNDDAPPALWLLLTADSSTLRTDDKWEASIAGSSWRNCALASIPRKPGSGNILGGGERVSQVLSKIWPTWIWFGFLAILLTVAADRWFRNDDVDLSGGKLFAAIGLCSLAWVILFWNNAKMLPFLSGYDFKDHVAYIKYIQDRGALPLPNEGYEMFQPPLFYGLAAGVLSILRLSTSAAAAVPVLRALTMLSGITNFVFAFLSVRLLFPRRSFAQLVGLITAAFLPMQLYLSHYVTNETFAATLGTISVYFALRVLMAERRSILQLVGLGGCVGAAMLSKATSLLLIPPLFGAIAIKLWQQRAPLLEWIRTFGSTVAAILLTCGWHYIRIWRHFGTPIVGNWDPILGFPWWQDPGFHTAADYFRFGQALIAPLFSGFHGFADGIYSTLWGDSLCGGLSGLVSRTPWNYNLMIGGSWLALAPTLLVVIGAAIAISQFVRRTMAEWLLVLGLSGAVFVALIFMTLKVPSYAQVKAFYGLAALAPFCAFTALGSQMLSARSRVAQIITSAFLIFFSINSFAAFWIRPTTDQHIYAALRAIAQSQGDRALSEALAAAQSAPSNATAAYVLAAIQDEIGESNKAVVESQRCIQLEESSSNCHFQLGVSLGKQREFLQAMSEARQALKLGPENPRAYDLVFTLSRQLHYSQEALSVGRDAVAVTPFDSDLHYRIGLAAGEIGDFTTATHQFGYALVLKPNRSEVVDKLQLAVRFAAQAPDRSLLLKEMATLPPDSPLLLNQLAWIFATHPDAALRDAVRAVDLAERACALTQRQQPAFLATAAAAYGEAGKFSEASAVARNALALAQAQGDTKTAALAEKMLTAFESNQPYREESY